MSAPVGLGVEAGAVRERLDRLRAGTPGAEAAFCEPWELRALALAVAAHDAGVFTWAQFQAALIAAVAAWEADPGADWRYYECWLTALESLLSAAGVLAAGDLDVRAAALSAAPPGGDHAHPPHREPVAVHPAG